MNLVFQKEGEVFFPFHFVAPVSSDLAAPVAASDVGRTRHLCAAGHLGDWRCLAAA